MEQDFYKWRLKDKFGLGVLIPDEKDIQDVHRIIYDELCLWKINLNSKEIYKSVISKLKN